GSSRPTTFLTLPPLAQSRRTAMAIKYDTDELGKTLDKLDQQLSKADDKPETSADLVKSLAEVAKGAIDLASERKEKRRGKKKAEDTALAKARDDDDDKDDDDDDKDDKDDKLPAWLKDKVDDGKAAGEMQYAGNRDDYGGTKLMTNAGGEHKQMGKSVQIGDTEVVDVGEYLDAQAQRQTTLGKSMQRQERLMKSLIQGLIEIESRIQQLEAQNEDQARFTGVCAKALGHLIEGREADLAQPTGGSRYAGMEKSIVLAQRQIDQEGGSVFKVTGPDSERNRELLAKAGQTTTITPEQRTYIKRTERLPAGITLN